MDSWLCMSVLVLCFAQLHGADNSNSGYKITPENLQTVGNITRIMPFSQWRKDKMTCKAKQFKMKIGDSMCEPKIVKNHYCIGFCNSLYVPQYLSINFKACKACLPKAKTKKTIAVNCMRNGKWVVVLKEVTFIKNCQCVTVEC